MANRLPFDGPSDSPHRSRWGGCVFHDRPEATGESVGTIRQMGFSVADPDHVRFDPEPPDLRDIEGRIVDWDLYERRRNVPIVPQRMRRAVLV